MTQLYTPFFGQMGKNIGEGIKEARVGKAMEGAYMGDPQAMAELMQLDPQQAAQVQNYQQRAAQQDLSAQRYAAQDARQAEQDARDAAVENQELLAPIMENAAFFTDYNEANAYVQGEVQQLRDLGVELPDLPFSEEDFGQVQQIEQSNLAESEETVGSPYIIERQDAEGNPQLVTAVAIRDKNGGIREQVLEGAGARVTGHDPTRRGNIKSAVTREGEKAERVQNRINAGLNSAYAVPDIQRAFDLMDEVEEAGDTGGGFEALITSARTYFGDPSKQITDRGELRTLLATDLLSKFETMTGVLSDSDIRLLRSISAGEDTTTPVNRRLLERMLRDAKRNIKRGYDEAVDSGTRSEVREFEEAAASLGMTLEGASGGGGGEAGSSQSNPMTIQKGAGKPPVGTWVKLPSGKVVQVTK